MKKLLYFYLFVLPVFLYAGTFDFYLPWDDDANNITDLSYLNHKPAGSLGFVTTGSDGHLYVNSGAQRIKFLGVNFTSASCFPSNSDADKIAKRLAKFGVNLVRFHLMDASWGESIINYSAGNSRSLNPATLSKFDYFFKALKDNGIYANINMLAGRDFLSGDGLPSSIDSMNWKDKQTPAMFDATMINLQKEFATALLTHINPYTGLSYANDPAVVFVEVCNEHGLIHAWHNAQMDVLPQEFKDELKNMWDSYLQNKYTNFSNLQNAWGISEPLGSEKLINRDFSSGVSPWVVEEHSPAIRTYAVIPNGYAPGINSLDITVTNTSPTEWHVQLNQATSILAGHPYTLSFSAKASANTTIQVIIQEVNGDWTTYFSRDINLTTNWQRFEFVFTVQEDQPNARLNFAKMADEALTYSFADFSFRQGGTITGLKSGETDFNSINIFMNDDRTDRTDAAKKDWVDFLWQKEYDYWNEMNNHIKSISNHFLTIGTVVGNSTPNIMNQFDVIDSHAYWQHPSFVVPWVGPWWIRNSSLVKQQNGATIAGLGLKRVYGKPFSVTEYNHPAPNTFDAETYIFLSAYAAFQDWDAIYGYTYDDGTRTWAVNKQNSWFDISRDPNKIMSFIPAACMFRRGDIANGSQLLRVTMTVQDEKNLLPGAYAWRLIDAENKGMQYEAPLLYKCAIIPDGVPDPGGLSPQNITIPSNKNFTSSTGELNWDTVNGVLKINASKIKGVLGYVIGNEYNLNNFIIRPLSAMQNWASIVLTLMQGTALETGAENILLTAHGLSANTGMDFRKYPENTPLGFPPTPDVDTNLANWGNAPTIAEGISAEFVIPYAYNLVKVYSLDNKGNRVTSIPVQNQSGNAKFAISDTYQTLWYEIAIYSTPPPTDTFTPTATFTITPGGPTFTPTITPTFTPFVSQTLLDNCEDANNQNNFGGYWYTYCDSNSWVLPSPQGSFIMASGGANSSSYAVRISGHVSAQPSPNVYPYVGLGTGLNQNSGPPNYQITDLRVYDGIKLWIKGNGETYHIKIPYLDNSGNNLTGYDDYKYSFSTASQWTQLTLPFSSFTQAGWGTSASLNDVLANAKELQWQIEGYNKDVDLWVDEIYFYRNTPTNTPTMTNTSIIISTNTPTMTSTGVIPVPTNTDSQTTGKLNENIKMAYIFPSIIDTEKTEGIYFLNLTEKFSISIYNLNGEQVFYVEGETKNGKYFFDIKNQRRKKLLTSGIYIFAISDKKGNFHTGKFAIISKTKLK